MRKKFVISCLCVLALLAACATTDPKSPEPTTPVNPEEALNSPALMTLDEALDRAVKEFGSLVEKKRAVGIEGFEAPGELSDFLIDELTERLKAAGHLIVMKRSGFAFDALHDEHEYQMSGFVSDESIVGIGHAIGKEVMITGTFSQFAGFSQLRVRSVDVGTEQILSQSNVRIRPDDALLAGVTGYRENAANQAITENALAHLNQGEDFLREGMNDNGIRELEQALADGDIVEAFFWRGYVYVGRGEFDRAVADFTAAIEIMPDHDRALNNRGITYSRKGEHNRAIADFTAALEIRPNDDKILINRYVAHIENGEIDLANADLAAAIEITNNAYNRSQAEPQPPKQTAALPARPEKEPKITRHQTDIARARLRTIGASIGSSFNDPLYIVTLHGTFALFKYTFLELGCDFGFGSVYTDTEKYYSVYPFAHAGLFFPFGGKGGFYTGAGGGWMIGEYTFAEGADTVNIPSFDFIAGFNILNLIDISYTLRTDFRPASVNNKASIGLVKRF